MDNHKEVEWIWYAVALRNGADAIMQIPKMDFATMEKMPELIRYRNLTFLVTQAMDNGKARVNFLKWTAMVQTNAEGIMPGNFIFHIGMPDPKFVSAVEREWGIQQILRVEESLDSKKKRFENL